MKIRFAFVATLTLFCSLTALAGEERAVTQGSAAQSKKLIEYGFEGRFRSEAWNNVDFNSTLPDSRNQFRFRTKFWTNVPLGQHVDVFMQLGNEFKKQATPELKFDPDEVFVDSFYVNVKDLFTRGLNLRVGRQNFFRGEGMVLMDGSPLEGSRGFYYNAINLSYSWRKSNLELIGIYNPRRDRFLPRVNNKDKYLNEWDEQAIGLYYSDKNHSRSEWESYYFYKKELHDYRAKTNPQFQSDRYLHTTGGRLVQTFGKGFTATGEAALQLGRQHPGVDVRGWSAYGYVKKSFVARGTPYVLAGNWAMSGDDPRTDAVEGWDPLFSRWPRWSDLYIYSQVREKGVSYWTNTALMQAEAGFTPHKKVALRATYYHMRAFHPFPGEASVFSKGKHRGDLLQARVDFKLNDAVRGHLQYESLLPGNFYSGQTSGHFVRSELVYQFKGLLHPWKSR
ncbi:MAG TPA: alginate export family protein [Clostridia bacterium]|nr:alginate export family protein [Clostridia bacterium]